MHKKFALLIPAKVAALTLAISMTLNSSSTHAGAIVGSTEFTQIANNVELVMQYTKQIESYVTQVKQYQKQLESLRKLDPSKLAGLLKGVMGDNLPAELERRLTTAVELGDRMKDLSKNMRHIYREGKIAVDTIKGMDLKGIKMSGGDYIEAMRKLAEMREEGYEERMQNLIKASTDSMSDIRRVEELAKLAPELSTDMEGFGALLQANAVMSGQLGTITQALANTAMTQTEAAAADVERRDEERAERKLKEMEVMRTLAPSLSGNQAGGSSR